MRRYFNATADAGYLNKTTGFCSYFLTFEDGARLEIMNQLDLVDNEKVLPGTGYVHIAFRKKVLVNVFLLHIVTAKVREM